MGEESKVDDDSSEMETQEVNVTHPFLQNGIHKRDIDPKKGLIKSLDVESEIKQSKCCKTNFCSILKTNPKLRHIWICLEFFALRVAILSADVVTDIATALTHFSSHRPHWGILTIVPILLPFALQVVLHLFGVTKTWIQNLRGGSQKETIKLMSLKPFWHLPIFQILRNIRMFFGIFLMDTSYPRNAVLVDQMKIKANDAGNLEAFLESAPQFILQSYIILQTGDISWTQKVGIPISFLSLLNSSIMMFFTQRLGKYQEPSPSIPAKLFVAPFVLLQLAGPLFSLVLMTLYFKELTILYVCFIGFTNFLIINVITRNISEYEKLYYLLTRRKEICKNDKNKIVSTVLSSSWVSTNIVFANNFKVKSKCLLITTFSSLVSHLIGIVAIFVAIISSKNSWSSLQFVIAHCSTWDLLKDQNFTKIKIFNRTYFWSEFQIVKTCLNCTDFVRICSKDEIPTDLFYCHLGPLALLLLLTSSVASVCIFFLGDNENLYLWSKKICFGKPIIHYTLIQDWIEAGKYRQIKSEMKNLDDSLINKCDPVMKQTCLHHIVKVTDTLESREILTLFLNVGGNDSIRDIYYRFPKDYMNSEQIDLLNNHVHQRTGSDSETGIMKAKRVWTDPPLHQMCKKKQKMMFTLSFLLGGILHSVNERGDDTYEDLTRWLDECSAIEHDKKIFSLWLKLLLWLIEKTDDFDRTLIHYGSLMGCHNLLKFCLDQGLQVDKQDKNGMSPIHLASWSGHSECLDLLLDKDAMINITDKKGWSSLHHAASYVKNDCVKVLIGHGAEVNLTDHEGDTPLHLVGDFVFGESDAEECCKMLLLAGADSTLKNNSNKTPMEKNKYLKILNENNPELFLHGAISNGDDLKLIE